MRKVVRGAVLLVVMAVGLAGGMALAATRVIAEIPFEFVVQDRTFTAGTYEVTEHNGSSMLLIIRNIAGGQSVVVPALARLAELKGSESTVVFDVADGKKYLSEIHVPGEDGYALLGAPGKHAHASVPGSKK